MSTRIARHIIIVVVVLVTLVGTAWLVWRAIPPPLEVQLQGVRTYDPRISMPEFTLTDHRSNPFTRANLTGGWTLLFFGYTHCPDVCPTTLSTLAQMMKQLTPATQPRVQVVFVSVDPGRDSPAAVAEFVSFFDSRIIGIAGHTDEQLQALTQPLNLFYEYEKNENENKEPASGYLVHHVASVLLIDPQGRLVADAAPPHTVETFLALITAARTTYGETL